MQAGKSNILFLTVCSYAKVHRGSAGGYDKNAPLPAILTACGEHDLVDMLYSRRRALFGLVTDTNRRSAVLYREDKPLSSLPSNQGLKLGPDFGKNPRGREIEYLAAIERYDDTFYRALGTAFERAELMDRTPHHVLIVSSLYGLLTPGESIQNYDLNVPEHPKARTSWTRDEFLTTVLLTYIRRNSIQVVFELIADQAYIDLFNWARVHEELGQGKVFHWECENLTGAAQLYYFGVLTKRLLKEPQPTLLSFRRNHVEPVGAYGEKVRFRPIATRNSTQIPANRLDMVGRMRGNIISALNGKFGGYNGRGGISKQVEHCASRAVFGDQALDSKFAGLISERFGDKRNDMEYGGKPELGGRHLKSEDWDTLVQAYDQIKERLQTDHGIDMDGLEHVDYRVPSR